MLVALAPLADAELLDGDVCVTGITGSSGSGNKPSGATHHPERATNIRSYKPLEHQHLLEVEHFLTARTERSFRLQFVPQSGPIVRGIFTTVFLPGRDLGAVRDAYRSAYDGEALVSIVEGSPDLRWVQGTPRTVIGISGASDRGVAVFSVIDNLGKGAAGQAIQNLNATLGWPPTAGLEWPGGFV
jgi:N-acetyl-gamma-glutamyl-phosphate reductase